MMVSNPLLVRAVVVDPQAVGRLSIQEVGRPVPGPSEALVRVAAISLNRGELRRAASANAGWRPGWDLAGTVEAPAADGSGPATGSRVVGFLPGGAWAELVAVPTNSVAELPPSVSFAQAATLPVAGLTALLAVEKAGGLLGRPVLITGASGGAGQFAVQLARNAGAHVTGLVHQEEHAAFVRDVGAHVVVAGEDATPAAPYGPFHLIVDSVGGRTLGTALGMLAQGGTCVAFGISEGPQVTFDVSRFYPIGGASLYGLILFYELTREPAAKGLGRLVRLVADGRLQPRIEVEAPWKEIGKVAQQLMDRRFVGKGVLHVG